MAKKRKKKHIPQRTCVGCRTIQPKRSMTRVVRTADGIQIDLTGKLPGRGAYLHNTKECWERGLKSRLSRALKTEISKDDRILISDFMASLSDEK